MDPESLQQDPRYGVDAIIDERNQALIEKVTELCANEPPGFAEGVTVRLVLFPGEGTAAITAEQQATVDKVLEIRRATRNETARVNFVDLVLQMCQLVAETEGRAAVAMGVSDNMLKRLKVATGGIDPETQRFPEVVAIRAAYEKLETTELRDASLKTLAVAVMGNWVDKKPDYYRIFAGDAEADGRVRDNDQCTQMKMLGLLIEELFKKCEQNGSTESALSFRRSIGRNAGLVSEEFPAKRRRIRTALEHASATKIFRMVVETVAGKQWYYDSNGKVICNYLWDAESLKKARAQLDRVSVDTTGAKISGSYTRISVAWSFVTAGLLISMLSGVLNWGSRETRFERVNDAFQTFLLFLAVPAFTVKIMSHGGEQAIKDWLTGAGTCICCKG